MPLTFLLALIDGPGQWTRKLRTNPGTAPSFETPLIALCIAHMHGSYCYFCLSVHCICACVRSSPDEEALTEFARFMGYELYRRQPPLITLRVKRPDVDGTEFSLYIIP